MPSPLTTKVKSRVGPVGLVDLVKTVSETVLLLPVLAAWVLLFRWSPDPP